MDFANGEKYHGKRLTITWLYGNILLTAEITKSNLRRKGDLNIMAKQAVQKQVTTLFTYIFKLIDRVCFVVLSVAGETQYNTCFDHGRATCSCPSHTECYHIRDLRPRYEAIRAARAESQAEAKLATFKAGQDAQYSAAPSKNEKRPPVFASATLEPLPDEDVAAYKARCEAAYQQERRQAAPLNGNRGFSLLR